MMVKRIHRKNIGILIAFLLAVSTSVNANTLTCGLKTVTLSGNTITKIVHEDGTIHTGGSVSNNWTYDGKSIKHRLMDDAIPCGTKAKSRDEVIAEIGRASCRERGSVEGGAGALKEKEREEV